MLLVLLLTATVPTGCFAAAHALPEGAVLAREDLAEVACRVDAPRAPLRYDRRDGLLVATAAVAEGSYLGRIALPARRRVATGAVLTLRSTAGPVVIERQVTALQPGSPGGRLFVQDSAGKVFSVPLVLEDRR